MRPLRAYLYAKDESGDWTCHSFRDLEPLMDAVTSMHQGLTKSLAIHVGFWRPDTPDVAAFLDKQPCQVFISKAAIGTFPPPVKVSAHAIGVAGEMDFHIVLDGFGFQIEDPTPAASPAAPITSTQVASGPIKPRGWLSVLASSRPAVAAELLAAGIWDEDSYLEHESKLPTELRHQVGLDRFFILAGERQNPNTIFDKLSFVPPWFLEVGINWLDLSVRSYNVCKGADIQRISDFQRYGLKGLHRLPNLGQKSVFEMSRKLVDLLTWGKPLKHPSRIPTLVDVTQDQNQAKTSGAHSESGPLGGLGIEALKDFNANLNLESQVEKSTKNVGNFIAGFTEAAQRLTNNERGIWAGRIGFRCKPMTLQEIGDQIELTRERVRQLEVKIYRRLGGHPFWAELSSKVLDHLKGRTSPLLLNGLSAIDPWFEGVEDIGYALGEVCKHIPSLGFHVFTVAEMLVISQISKADWLKAIDNGRALLKVLLDQHIMEDEGRIHIDSFLMDKSQELRVNLWREVSSSGVWAEMPGGGRKLIGFGKTAQSLILSILEASDTPLHVDEICKRANETSHDSYSINSIRNATRDVGFLFGRGTYGLLKHCPLTPAEMQSIRAEVEDIMPGGGSQKQWHSNELLDELLDRGFEFQGRLTKYIINMSLVGSPNIVYLKRMIYGMKGQWSESAESRLDVRQAVIALLEAEGRSMTTDEVRARLAAGRGVNVHFQIFPSSPVIRIKPGVWGLEYRDVQLPDAKQITLKLVKDLSYRQAGLHISEVVSSLGLESEDDVILLVSLGQKEGLRIDRGQYCYLQSWGESRRISVQDATLAILKSYVIGLSHNEIHQMVEQVTKRPVQRQHLSTVLQNLDAWFDPATGLWKMTGVTEDEPSDEDLPIQAMSL